MDKGTINFSSNVQVFVWGSSPPIVTALMQVLKTLGSHVPRGFVFRAEFLDTVTGQYLPDGMVCVLCAKGATGSVDMLCQALRSPAWIIVCDLDNLNQCLDTRKSMRHGIIIHYVSCERIVNVLNVALRESKIVEIQRLTKRVPTKEVNMKFKEAEDAARQLLTIERLQAINGSWPDITEIELESLKNPPLLSPDPRRMRRELWHLWKNLLKRNVGDYISKEVIQYSSDLLSLWEQVEIGYISSSIKDITHFLEEGKKQDAAKLAELTYGKLVERNQVFHEGLPMQTEGTGQTQALQKSLDTLPLQAPKKFSILVVDDSRSDLDYAMNIFARLSASCQNYTIDISLVDPANAFDDAVRRLEKDPFIQAVVIDWDLSAGKMSPGRENQTGADLIQKIKRDFPGIFLCLLTGRGVMRVLNEYKDFDVRPYDKNDITSIEEIFADIIQNIRKREETPFFDALKQFSQRPVTVFHAMTISRGKTLRKSTWLRDFYDFYGERVFMAETSSTEAPMDSLFDPKGSIKAAQDRAALVFGADRTFFVTNGTSTANKIVHQAILKPGDIVLIDRNCHKSHHYGMVLMGARPVYLQAEPLYYADEFTGICKGVATSEIISQLDKYPNARMLCLTNCTFDGYIHNISTIVRAVHEKLREMKTQNAQGTSYSTRVTDPRDFVFLFDEAWFGYARFSNKLRPFTAMAACASIPEARIYVTQSTHKTLTAFRQASMIHVKDFLFKEDVEHSFNEALYTHTSTSPNYNLIASLDAGRMQADLEGPIFCNDAWNYASRIRDFIAGEEYLRGIFSVLTPEEMGCRGGGQGDFDFDITKLTLFLHRETGLTGSALRRLMLDDFDIQFNKVTPNTALLMINTGSTESSIGHLATTLRRLASMHIKQKPGPRNVKLPSGIFERRVRFWQDNNALREHFFGQFENAKEHNFSLDEVKSIIKAGDPNLVSANFVIPYPPGFPVLVPGEIIDLASIDYLRALGMVEIHGMPCKGRLKVWEIENP